MECPFCKSRLNEGASVCGHCGAERSFRPGFLVQVLFYLIPIIVLSSIFIAGTANTSGGMFIRFIGTNLLLFPLGFIIIKIHRGNSREVWVRKSCL